MKVLVRGEYDEIAPIQRHLRKKLIVGTSRLKPDRYKGEYTGEFFFTCDSVCGPGLLNVIKKYNDEIPF